MNPTSYRVPAARVRRWATAPLALLLLAVAPACGDRDPAPRYRHVVLVSLDTTRADHLGCYGNREVKTPALDALARESVRFSDCTSAAATTLASHVSLMTGLVPPRHGVPRNGFVVDEANELLAERLAPLGFHCAGFVGSAALVARTGLADGFAHWDETFETAAGESDADQSQRSASAVTDAVLAHVDEVLALDGADGGRMFLFAHYFDPHAPYAPPSAEVARYGAAFPVGGFSVIEAAVRQQQERATGRALGQNEVINRGLSEELLRGVPGVPTDIGRTLAQLYAGEVTAMDAALGRLFAGLAARGILDDAIVIVTADHGETFWEHGNVWNHGLWVSQTDVHVPLIVRLPGGRGRGTVVDAPVSGVDVTPTVLELLGAPPPRDEVDPLLQGRSLVGAIDGDALVERTLFSFATQPGPSIERAALRWAGERKPVAVRRGPWKLVDAPYLELRQLFHLGRDPAERADLLAGGAPDGDARAALDALAADLARMRAASEPRPSTFDREQARALVGLGYTESAGPK